MSRVTMRGGDLLSTTDHGFSPKPMTLTILGCGTLGIAILSGILSSLHDASSSIPSPAYPDSGTVTPTTEGPPPRTPSRFIACVRRPESAKRINNSVAEFPSAPVTVLQNENVKGVSAADVIILGCKPYMVSDILSEPGMREALKGKLLISICAGVPVGQIEETLYGQTEEDRLLSANSNTTSTSIVPSPYTNANVKELQQQSQTIDRCKVVRVMPNTAAVVRESMTVIASRTPPLPPQLATLTTWIFTRIGRVVHLPPAMMDVSTALCGSGPAFLALMLESLADGAVAMGLPRAEAQLMAAQTMRGTAGIVLGGEHPALVREKVSTPGGCTIGGLLVLEEGTVRGTVARCIREATVVAGQLGKGAVGVNGPRR